MGYTNYWHQHNDFTDTEWGQIKEEYKYIKEACESIIVDQMYASGLSVRTAVENGDFAEINNQQALLIKKQQQEIENLKSMLFRQQQMTSLSASPNSQASSASASFPQSSSMKAFAPSVDDDLSKSQQNNENSDNNDNNKNNILIKFHNIILLLLFNMYKIQFLLFPPYSFIIQYDYFYLMLIINARKIVKNLLQRRK